MKILNFNKNEKRIILSAVLIQSIEFYDLVLIGFFAEKISEEFFQFDNKFYGLIFTLFTFSIGFLARPIGAMIFGYIGDIYGRKKAFCLSVTIMAISTMTIGILPSYSSWGIISTILLMLSRFFQGISVGGEYSGSTIFFLEHAKTKNKITGNAIISSGAIFGFFVASFITNIVSFFSFEYFWRLPFILGSLAVIGSFYVRSKLNETPAYQKLIAKKKELGRENLYFRLYTKYLKESLVTIGLGWAMGSLSLTIVTYLKFHISNFVGVDYIDYKNIHSIAIFFYAICTIISGMVSDRFNNPLQVILCSLYCELICLFPCYYFLSIGSFSSLLFGSILFAATGGFLFGPINYVTYKLFPTEVRYTGVALNFSIGLALFGGTSPLFQTMLSKQLGIILGPSLYLFTSAMIGLISIRFIGKNFSKSFSQ